MKAARVVLVSAGALLILLLVALGLAMSTPVQTWAARRALAAHPELGATVDSVSAGLQSVQVRALHVNSNGAVLTLPALDVGLPMLSAGLSQRLQVKSLVAKGWTLDLTRAQNLLASFPLSAEPTSAVTGSFSTREFSLVSTGYAADSSSATQAVFRGVFAELHLPVDLSMDGVELEGDVILPQTERGVARLHVTIKGGGLAAGHEGQFVVDVAGAKTGGDTLNVRSNVMAMMDTPRTFSRLATKANATATGVQYPSGAVLNIDATAVRSAGGETYNVTLAGVDKQLADIRAELTRAAARITGTWKLDVHDTDLTPFALGRSLPTFQAVGQGGFETETTLKEIHASGRLDASANRLEVVRPELSAVGAVNVAADFDVLHHGQSLRVERLNATITSAAPVGTIRALQSFEFNLGTGELRVADPAQDLLGISLTGLPIAWMRPFTGDAELSGGDIRGELAASARDGGLALRARVPLTVSGLNLASAGKPMLAGVDLTLNASADYAPGGWQAQIVEFTLRSRSSTLLSLNAKAGQLNGQDKGIKVTGRWSADLPGWAAQPCAAGQLQLSAGLAQGDFNANLDGTKAFEAKLAVTNLAATTKEPLPAVNVEVRADVAPDGKITFNAPLSVEQAKRKSDLLFGGTLTPGATGMTIDARLSSERVALEDVQLLGLLVPGGSKHPSQPEGPDTKPFWGALRGQVTLALKKVAYADSFEATEVGGVIRIDAAALKFEEVRAAFGPESDLKLGGGVAFNPKAADPYQLASNVALTNFDAASAFRAANPAQLPTIEEIGRAHV